MAFNVWTYVCWETSQQVRLQVIGAPCWLGTFPSVLLRVRNRQIFPSNLPKCLKWLQKALFMLSCCFQVFSQNFPFGAPELIKQPDVLDSSNDDIITIMGYDLPRTQTSLYKQTSKQELVYTKKKKNLFQIGARKLVRRFSDDFPLVKNCPGTSNYANYYFVYQTLCTTSHRNTLKVN